MLEFMLVLTSFCIVDALLYFVFLQLLTTLFVTPNNYFFKLNYFFHFKAYAQIDSKILKGVNATRCCAFNYHWPQFVLLIFILRNFKICRQTTFLFWSQFYCTYWKYSWYRILLTVRIKFRGMLKWPGLILLVLPISVPLFNYQSLYINIGPRLKQMSFVI